MKQTIIIFTVLISFNFYSQEKFFDSTCDCINQIEEKSNQAIIAENIQNCFQKSFQNHNSKIENILQNYVTENPETDLKYAEKNLSKILTEKLHEKCPTFKEIDRKLAGQQQNSKNILSVVANEICTELKDKTNLTDKIIDPIIIEVTKRYQVSIYGQYNLDERSEMKRLGLDLNTELMKKCTDYKTFVDKKNIKK